MVREMILHNMQVMSAVINLCIDHIHIVSSENNLKKVMFGTTNYFLFLLVLATEMGARNGNSERINSSAK